ncbi:hypothetical protein [Streptomyces sp. ODS28]|uniref:hypothetical protein n=1 Tax=Streptomyces sp. ODS28 TaxID=3136688 RepID=UPI0031E5791E
MGSLRNPIGPLPSSIYWRRRAVALAVLALLVLLIVWAFSLGGGGGSSDQGKGGNGGGPANSITPGPTDSGPAISERPGGRDEVGSGGSGADAGGAGTGGGTGADAGGGSGSGGSGDADGSGAGWAPGPGSGTDAETGTDGGGGGADGSGGSGSGGGGAAGAGGAVKSLPACSPSAVDVSLNSVKDTYEPGEKPKFELTAKNKQGAACKIDLSRTATVVTIEDADGKKVWASDDCPREKQPVIAEIPANGESTHTLTWLRKPSADNCGTPPAGSAKAGSYEVKVSLHGMKRLTAKFALA